MAVVDIARETTAEVKEKFLLRYKNKAYKKILNNIHKTYDMIRTFYNYFFVNYPRMPSYHL